MGNDVKLIPTISENAKQIPVSSVTDFEAPKSASDSARNPSFSPHRRGARAAPSDPAEAVAPPQTEPAEAAVHFRSHPAGAVVHVGDHSTSPRRRNDDEVNGHGMTMR